MNVKELKLHQMEVIMENELSDGVISSKEPPKEHEILWEGRPFMPAYLLGGEGTLLFTIIVFVVLTYWGYTLIWLDCLMAAIVLFEWIQVIAHYASRRYYITTRGTVVRRNSRYYLIRWQFINPEKFRTRSGLINLLFGCRTISFARNYGFSSTRGANANLWRYIGTFACIRHADEIRKMLEQRVS